MVENNQRVCFLNQESLPARKETLVVQLSDGLGNQLFQYAFALALQKMTGRSVLLDVSWFPEFGGRLRKATPRHFGLGPYSLSLPFAPTCYAGQLVYGKSWIGKLCRAWHIRRNYLSESNKHFDASRLAELPSPMVIRGFFQKAAYAESVREQLLGDFSLHEATLPESNRAMLESIRADGKHAVMVHIRRGDYLNPEIAKVHGGCTLDYYRRAEEYIAAKVGHPLHLFIFSDDPDWVIANYQTSHEKTVVNLNDGSVPHLDINLMRHCSHAIIANSTFSWWGAWLIGNPEKQVVAPAAWFADARNTAGLLPAEWTTM